MIYPGEVRRRPSSARRWLYPSRQPVVKTYPGKKKPLRMLSLFSIRIRQLGTS
jgi:hypothetical protein